MGKFKLDRRTFLRGVLGGGAIALALPPLEAFFDDNGLAYAIDGTFPKRFGMFFWGNGILPERWIPQTTGADWALTDELAPLASVKDAAFSRFAKSSAGRAAPTPAGCGRTAPPTATP